MRETKCVNVIIPAYNAEKTLRRCVDSLLNQTMLDGVEIIIIDDGSVDSTYDIICDYESKYPNIIRGYKNNINKGLGTTRNIGLEKCNAEYIIFVDADDYVSTYYIEKLYNKAIMEHADIVTCGCYRIKENGDIITESRLSLEEDSSYTSRKKNFFMSIGETISYCTMLVHKDIYINSKFKCVADANFDEDIILYAMFFLYKKIACIDENLYYWVWYDNSMSNNTKKGAHIRIELMYKILEMVKEWGIYEKYQEEWKYFLVFSFCQNIYEFENKSIYPIFPYEYVAKAYKELYTKYPDCFVNKYLLLTLNKRVFEFSDALRDGEKGLYTFVYGQEAYINIEYDVKIRELFLKYEDKRIALYGAGKKGQALLNFDHKGVNGLVNFIIDKNADLKGEYIGNIPIISLDEAIYSGIDVIFVMNYRHYKSVIKYLHNKKCTCTVVNLEMELFFGDKKSNEVVV